MVRSGKPCPAFKLVILDEADSMTPSAQVCYSCSMIGLEIERHDWFVGCHDDSLVISFFRLH